MNALLRHKLVVATLLAVVAGGFILASLWFVGRNRESVSGRSASAATVTADAASPRRVAPGVKPDPESRDRNNLPHGVQFSEIADQAGVRFTVFEGKTGDYWLPETMGGGIAVFDYDGDGWMDLYFANGCKLPVDGTNREQVNRLFRNCGRGFFCEVTEHAGADDNGYGMGVCAGDFDNDGFQDLYVTNYGSNVLFHNRGDGTFTEVTREAGAEWTSWSTSCAFGDIDRDGDLDLFVCNYVVFDPATAPICRDPLTGLQKYCGPDYLKGLSQVLFVNNGDGSFRDASDVSGVGSPTGRGLGVVIADLDDDEWPDIFVANDLLANFLFCNATAGATTPRFVESAYPSGVAVNGEGVREANMGVACGDYDGNGRLDLYVTHYYLEHDTLWRNVGPREFVDSTNLARLAAPTRSQLSWGTGFCDFDNDGWLDLFVTSGHINDNEATNMPYTMPAQLFRNTGLGYFNDVSTQVGPYFRDTWIGRGAAFGDLDNDGDADIVVSHLQKRPVAVLRNETQTTNHVLELRLAGRVSNRDAIGARVTVLLSTGGSQATGRKLVRQIIRGGSYLCSSDLRLQIGLGDSEEVAEIEIRWPSGETATWENVRADRSVLIQEGRPELRADYSFDRD